MTSRFTAFLGEIGKNDTGVVGGKGANLGEMVKIGMPVPPGFVVTAAAYRHFLTENDLQERMKPILENLDVNDSASLDHASVLIKKLIVEAPVPPDLQEEINRAYKKLGSLVHQTFAHKLISALTEKTPVAVRSSATSEDSKAASFAGQNETFLNISGEKELVSAVRRCYASLFDGRSIFYRVQNHFDHFQSAIAVVVQTMVRSEVSGILFSIDPVTNNSDRVVVEAVWGLGEYIVQGKVTPDHYEVAKDDRRIVEKKVVSQTIKLTRKGGNDVEEVRVPDYQKDLSKLTDEQIGKLAQLSMDLEKHYQFPQDSEFAVEKGKIFLVQTRPVTTIKRAKVTVSDEQLAKLELILEGAPASPGVASGPVKVLKSAAEIGKIKDGDVLVATQTNPDYVPAMKKAAAIVTDSGGRTSHAAIVSRELGIPAVVGTEKATTVLKNKQTVTVAGGEGKVFRGKPEETKTIKSVKVIKTIKSEETKRVETKTKVYVNLAEPEKAKEIAGTNCDGVGLLRAEFMLAGIGTHPKEAIATGKEKEYVASLVEGLREFAAAFYPRPVVYRATDFKTNEYRSLTGGHKYEPVEANPMIGFRGAYRYIVQPEVFQMEIEAIKRVREKEKFDNLHLMIPFCRTVAELSQVKELVVKFGLRRSENFKLWMMCEIPANVILLDKFIEEGLDGISVGSNDLTMLTLGVDRDNENVAAEYSELNEAVLLSLERIVKICREKDVTCSICGQAPSDYPALTRKLVEWGITSVSVNPDVVDKTREIVYEAEKRVQA